jgi:UDP-N-acetylglucosamine--N-acetylmuramyl-(pentapeptide) pyrophosphoryl-undecaprenol N-acetylglucosamine transferase
MDKRPTRIMISGGGTGGGVYPALAVAAALTSPPVPLSHPGTGLSGEGESVELLWIGGSKGPEKELVTREGIPFESVASAPIAGMGWRVILAPFKIGWGLLQSLAIVRKFRPDALLITGGWVTIPPALACWLMRVPVMIFCPDVEPGGTINVLKRIAAKVGIVSPEARKFYRDDQVIEAGYPLRAELLRAAGFDGQGKAAPGGVTKGEAHKHFGLSGSHPTLLVFGGSTGARSINRAVADDLPSLLEDWQVIHISGRLDAEWVRAAATTLTSRLARRYHGFEYLHGEDMARALAAADLALARAGASALGEFPLFSLPAILVPYPYAWRTQKVNADRLATQGAAVRLDDDRLGQELMPLLGALQHDRERRARMAQAAASLKRPDAAARLAEALVLLADQRRV